MSSSDAPADAASSSAPTNDGELAAAMVELRAVIASENLRLAIESGRLTSAYDVGKAVGRGKFATVYRATRREDGCTVALKQIALFDVMDRRGREKCLKEIRLVQSLDHPRIIKYIDGFIDGAQLVLVFEYAGAGDLKRQLRKARERAARFEEALVWKYFSQIAEAVAYMHSCRILHRDLKPANVLLTLSGEVKVGDLGLGRLLGEHTLAAHSKVGTPLYMAPEALRGGGVDYAADVWSLGCILYELAMTLSPFKTPGLSLAALFDKITAGVFTPVSEIYSAELRSLVRGMLSIDPTERPSMAQVAATAERMRGETSRAKYAPAPALAPAPSAPASLRFRAPPREEVIALAEAAPCVAGAALRDRLILLGFFKDDEGVADAPPRIAARSIAAADSSFALANGPVAAQFSAFCVVAIWLAGSGGGVSSGLSAAATSLDDGSARTAVAAILSRDVFAPRNIPAPAAALASGSGSALVIALSLLADQIAESRGLTFAAPSAEGKDELDDSIESQSASASGGVAEESRGEDEYSVGVGGAARGGNTLCAPAAPNIDAADWFAEVYRGTRAMATTSVSAPRVNFSALGGAWRDRVGAMAGCVALFNVDGVLGDWRSRLLALADECSESAQTIGTAEARLNREGGGDDGTTLNVLARAHASTASARAVSEDGAARARAAVGEARLSLIAVSEALEDVEAATLARRAELSGSERLIKVRAALSSLAKESAELDVRLGLARARALRLGRRDMFEK